MIGPKAKTSARTRWAYVRVGNKAYKVPAQRAKQFRAAMGAEKPIRKSNVPNQWQRNPYSPGENS